uniref:Uncharacterized protein n=1 Tax=Peronospora matthiolae TaxID=2874970 RepID=A0AAV1T8R6_9STRA
MSFVLMEEINDFVSNEPSALAKIDDTCNSTSNMSGVQDEIHFPSHFKNCYRVQNREQYIRSRQRQNEEQQSSQMQMQFNQTLFSCMENSDGNIARNGLKAGAKGSSCVTLVPQPQLKVKPLNAPPAKILTMANRRPTASKQSAVESVSFASSRTLRCTTSTCSSDRSSDPTTLLDDPDLLKRDLMALMDEMYNEAKAMCGHDASAIASTPTITCQCDKRMDSKEGNTTHIRSETPLECCLDTAREFLAAMFSLPQPCLSEEMTRTESTVKPVKANIDADYRMSGAKECLDGIGLLRRHTEEDCELIIWAAVSFHDSGKISFQERSWAVATRSATSTSHQESVVRTDYRLSSSKVKRCLYIGGENINQVRDHVIGAKSVQVKANYRMLQRKMLIETGRADLASFVG